MPRNISFALTTKQIRNGTKTVTRRIGWWNLKVGEILNACVKCMGFRKGEKIEVIRQIRIISTRREQLYKISKSDVKREGFPQWNRIDFLEFFMDSHNCDGLTEVNRIEFEYL